MGVGHSPLKGLRQTLSGVFLLRRVVVELRGIRRALERHADARELQASASPSPAVAQTTFRSYSRTKGDLSERDLKGLTEVSYVDEQVLGQMLAREDELRALLGRDPTEAELERAYRGDVE